MNEALIEFNPKLPKLSANEKAVLKLLVEAAKLIAPVYRLQNDQKFPGANFYPHDVTKKEIDKATARDPQILSSYTVVERIGSKLVSVPYHVKYADLLKPIVEKLRKAADITDNKEFSKALTVQAQALLDGSYEKATATWLGMKPYILDISIGPNDYFDDQLFFTKNSYQAWVGVVDAEGTDRLNNYKSTILNAHQQGFVSVEKLHNHNHLKAKVLNTVLFSGLMAKTKFLGVNYPIDINIVEKYGSEITLFNQPSDLIIKEEIMPTINRIFSKAFKGGYGHEDLSRGNLRYTAMHELAHSYLYYKHAAENLQDLFRPIYELAATLLGFRLAGSLLLKDRINNKQLESMIVVFLCRSYFLVNQKPNGNFLPEYTQGSKVFINYLIKSGALQTREEKIFPNFMKIFVALQDLFHILEHLLAGGSHKEAKAFISRYL